MSSLTRNLEDLCLRRTKLGHEHDPGCDDIEKTAGAVAGVLGWDEERSRKLPGHHPANLSEFPERLTRRFNSSGVSAPDRRRTDHDVWLRRLRQRTRLQNQCVRTPQAAGSQRRWACRWCDRSSRWLCIHRHYQEISRPGNLAGVPNKEPLPAPNGIHLGTVDIILPIELSRQRPTIAARGNQGLELFGRTHQVRTTSGLAGASTFAVERNANPADVKLLEGWKTRSQFIQWARPQA